MLKMATPSLLVTKLPKVGLASSRRTGQYLLSDFFSSSHFFNFDELAAAELFAGLSTLDPMAHTVCPAVILFPHRSQI